MIDRRQIVRMLGVGLVAGIPAGCGAGASSRPRDVAAEDEPIVCSPDRPSARPGEMVALRVWRAGVAPHRGVTWTVEAGVLQEAATELRWNLATVPPRESPYTATVRAGGGSEECTVKVLVVPPPQFTVRGGEAAWSLLSPRAAATPGYGLYSYLLFGAQPLTDADRQRYLATVQALLRLAPSLALLLVHFKPEQVNITQVPVATEPPSEAAVDADWVLGHYDYARARRLLSDVDPRLRRGPYVVAASTPTPVRSAGQPLLLLDFSTVPPTLAGDWMRDFLNQAAQERYWERATLRRIGMKSRVVLTVLGQGLPEIRKAVSESVRYFE